MKQKLRLKRVAPAEINQVEEDWFKENSKEEVVTSFVIELIWRYSQNEMDFFLYCSYLNVLFPKYPKISLITVLAKNKGLN